MQIGLVGLGRMGANMARRLIKAGHSCVVTDLSADAVAAMARDGATGAGSLEALVAALAQPRVVWVMVPAGEATERTVATLGTLLSAGDIVIDGGNSWFKDDVRRGAALARAGHPLCRCGHQRRRLGRRPRLLSDGRRARPRPSRTSSRSFARWRPARPASRRRAAATARPAPRTWATCTAVRSARATSSR